MFYSFVKLTSVLKKVKFTLANKESKKYYFGISTATRDLSALVLKKIKLAAKS